MNCSAKEESETNTHSQIRIIIKLFTHYELLVGSVNLIENLPDSRLETCLEVILQLTYVSCTIEL